MIKRNTIQCALVLDAVNKLKCHATAEEVYEELMRERLNISRGTVYRNLQRLCEEGSICRRQIPGGPDRFDHLCGDHYHARCVRCGRVFDVDMDHMKGLEDSIKDARGFLFTGHDIVFKGLCPDCRKEAAQGAQQAEKQ